MQGHPVSGPLNLQRTALTISKDGILTPSLSFRTPRQGGLQFMEMLSESLSIIGAILAVVHPTLFEAGLDAIAELYSGPIDVGHPDLLRKVLEIWGSPFTAVSVIVNRETELHRDTSSPVHAYDILYTGGGYSEGRFEVHGLGLRCRYNPGTVVATLAAVFPHSVGPVNGERVCLAHFFRESAINKSRFFRFPTLPTYKSLNRVYFSGFPQEDLDMTGEKDTTSGQV
jgi:Oxygenase domain of the 2OGFeDO superfamily